MKRSDIIFYQFLIITYLVFVIVFMVGGVDFVDKMILMGITVVYAGFFIGCEIERRSK